MSEPGTAIHHMALVQALDDAACLTTEELGVATGLPRRVISQACYRMLSAGLLLRRERGCFQLSPEGLDAKKSGKRLTCGPRGPLTQSTPRLRKATTGRDRVWRAIRILRKFGISELVEASGATQHNILKYVAQLEAAGYLHQLRREPGISPMSNGRCRWSLVDDTGPLAPIYQTKTRSVHDRNTGLERVMMAKPKSRRHK